MIDESTAVALAAMFCLTVVAVTFIRAFFVPGADGNSQFLAWGERVQQQNSRRLAAELEKERMLRGVYVIQSSNGVHIIPAAGSEADRPQATVAVPATAHSSKKAP